MTHHTQSMRTPEPGALREVSEIADFVPHDATILGDLMRQRLDYLKPLVDEHDKLAAALVALNASSIKAQVSAQMGSRRGRPRGSGKNADQVLALLDTDPGLTYAQIHEKTGIGTNQLYRILPALFEEGKVAKGPDNAWHPAHGPIGSTARSVSEES